MAQCTFCGEDAGLFRQEHEACRARHDLLAEGRSAILQAVATGIRIPIEPEDYSIRLREDESICWVSPEVAKLQVRTRRVAQGRSSGVSVRVARGVSFRIGASRGVSVPEDYVAVADAGLLMVTTRAVHFQGRKRTERIDLKSIVSCEAEAGVLALDTTRSRLTVKTPLLAEAGFLAELIETILDPSEYNPPLAEPVPIGHCATPDAPSANSSGPPPASQPPRSLNQGAAVSLASPPSVEAAAGAQKRSNKKWWLAGALLCSFLTAMVARQPQSAAPAIPSAPPPAVRLGEEYGPAEPFGPPAPSRNAAVRR